MASSAAIEKWKGRYEAAKRSSATTRRRVREQGETLERKAVMFTASYTVGRLAARGQMPKDVMGLDPMVAGASVAYALSLGSSGRFGQVADAVGDALMCVAAAGLGMSGSPAPVASTAAPSSASPTAQVPITGIAGLVEDELFSPV